MIHLLIQLATSAGRKNALPPKATVKATVVYPLDYNKNNPVYRDAEFRYHIKTELIITRSKLRTLEAFDHIDDVIYHNTYWKDCSFIEVSKHLQLAERFKDAPLNA